MRKSLVKKAAVCAIILFFIATNTYSANPNIKTENTTYENIGTLNTNTLYVDDNSTYPGNGTILWPYRYIWQAIENASLGDIIFVYSGSYDNPSSNNVTVNKYVHLLGENISHPQIRGNLIVTGNSMTIKNFNIGSITNHGISLESCSNCTISECFSQYINMIDSNENEIKNCTFTTTINTMGAALYNSNHNKFIGNIIQASSFEAPNYGFILENSDYNTITGNICNVNPFTFTAPSVCIWLKTSDNNYVSNNICSGSDFGIQITNSKNNTIDYNMVKSDKCGIQIESSSVDNMISNNTIKENAYGLLLVNTFNNQILHNNFTDNANLSIYCSQSFKDEIHYNNIKSSNLLLLFAERSYSSATWNWWGGFGPLLRTFRFTFGFVFVRPCKHSSLPNICP